MKNLFFLFFLTLSFSSFAQQAPDHCKVASDKVKEAANNVGNGNFGTAGENIGEAAAAAALCIRDKVGN